MFTVYFCFLPTLSSVIPHPSTIYRPFDIHHSFGNHYSTNIHHLIYLAMARKRLTARGNILRQVC